MGIGSGESVQNVEMELKKLEEVLPRRKEVFWKTHPDVTDSTRKFPWT